MMKNKKAWVWLWLSVFIILLDQGSKYFADHYLPYGKQVVLAPFFNLWLKYNAGSAFGFLHNAGGWQVFFLSGIAIVVTILLITWLAKTARSDWMMALALNLILGGALGNLIDRLHFDYVIDFFDFHMGGWNFATFNVADSAITVGAVFLVIRVLFFKDK